jgi:hypothetical protein
MKRKGRGKEEEGKERKVPNEQPDDYLKLAKTEVSKVTKVLYTLSCF